MLLILAFQFVCFFLFFFYAHALPFPGWLFQTLLRFNDFLPVLLESINLPKYQVNHQFSFTEYSHCCSCPPLCMQCIKVHFAQKPHGFQSDHSHSCHTWPDTYIILHCIHKWLRFNLKRCDFYLPIVLYKKKITIQITLNQNKADSCHIHLVMWM